MDLSQIIFAALAIVILGSGVLVVTTRNMVHAALWLIVTLFGVAALYAYLSAGFLAVVQVVIYIGAIAILFIFAVMLTRRELLDRGPQQNSGWWLSAIVALMSFGGLFLVVRSWAGFWKAAPAVPATLDPVSQLGVALISPDGFVLPFEVASVLLLAALIGAVYIAFARK